RIVIAAFPGQRNPSAGRAVRGEARRRNVRQQRTAGAVIFACPGRQAAGAVLEDRRMTSPSLITASPENASQFAHLHALCFEDAWSADFFAKLFSSPGVAGWLAGHGQNPEGFLVQRVAADECEILTLGTRPDIRRNGLARLLLRHGAQSALALGAHAMFLEVAESNIAAQALYAALGFKALGRRPA